MELTDGGPYKEQAKRPSSSNGKEEKAMRSPEMIGSHGSAGLVFNSISTRRTTKPTSPPLEVSTSMWRESFVEKVPIRQVIL